MKREFLKELGLEKEVIDKIMKEHGDDIEAEKAKGAENLEAAKKLEAAEKDRDSYKERLETAEKTLKGFEGVDVEKLKEEIGTLQTNLETQAKEHEAEMTNIAFNGNIEKALADAGVKNSKAALALLDIDGLKESKDQTADIKAAIEKVKEANDYLFGSTEPINNPVGPTSASIVGLTKEDFKKMGYKERLELKQKSPEKYDELKGE
ncbi:MAG: phage scaffolding protein [Sporomusa sp.]